MNSSSGSPINPFECFQRPRFVITKNRGDSFNPFNLNKNDSNENDFNFSIKFKTKHKQDSGINPFQSAYKDKAPFLKGIQNTHTLIKGLNKNDNKDNIANNLKNNQPMIFQPNINIYICDENFFDNKREKDSNQGYIKTEIKKKDCSKINKIKNEAPDKIINEEKDKKVLNMAQNLNMAAPPIVNLCEITNLMENLNLDNNNEKMYTNNEDFSLGEKYIE